ncbi:MAG: class I SAM-dependent methyltransferase [Chloroflexi bacterium]|nr:class I SAM-dependent methyltransferase [Chloroflexota bacterium]
MSNPRAPIEEYGEQYFKQYNYADRPLGRFSMYWFARRYYAAMVRRYAPHRGGRLLEMGCGLGHLLGLLQDDFACMGIDLAGYCVQQTQQNAPRARALQRDADDLGAFSTGSYSVVVALHLVEHLPDPARTLQQVARILEQGGLLLLATPNPEYTLRRRKDPTTDAIGKDPTHINVQPPAHWRALLAEAGFSVARHWGDGLWDVPYWPVLPKGLQFALFGLPAFAQVVTRISLIPVRSGVNQIIVAHKGTPAS